MTGGVRAYSAAAAFAPAYPAASDECRRSRRCSSPIWSPGWAVLTTISAGIDVGAPVGRLDAGFRHFRHLPRNMLRLQEEHFIGAAETAPDRPADAHFHGVRARLQHGENARGTAYFTAQRLQRGEDCRWMMGEIIIHGDAVGFAAQLRRRRALIKLPSAFAASAGSTPT